MVGAKPGKKRGNRRAKSETTLEDRMDKQLRDLQQQQAELRRVQEETIRIKQVAEEEAQQTKKQAMLEAEAMTRRVFEEITQKRDEMNAKAQQQDVDVIKKAAKAEAAALRIAAQQEAERLRRNAEEEAAALRKLAEDEAAMLRNVEAKKRQMEDEVSSAAARARDKMSSEVEALRRRAEAEVLELKQKAAKEAAAMFQRAEKNVQSAKFTTTDPSPRSEKPPRPPSTHDNPAPQRQPEEKLPNAVTPPRSPVVGSERQERHQEEGKQEAWSADASSPRQQAKPNWTSSGWGQQAGGNALRSGSVPSSPGAVSTERHLSRNDNKQQSTETSKPSGGMVPDMTQPVPYKMKTCTKFMQTGHCKRGAACTYAHGEHEIGMPRPDSLRGVTLGDMNARKKGKNMITQAEQAATLAAAQAAQASQAALLAQQQPALRPPQAPASAPSNGSSSLRTVPASTSAMKSQWDKPPKIATASKLFGGMPAKKAGDAHPNPQGTTDVSMRNSDGKTTKEPSPFLPLSPSLDEPWQSDSDGRKAMSWADSSVTPPATGPTTP
eukprot:TRINITY_DN4450_c0_g2_i2.p1 TRINITY_DN4450_c0_g2~~TRINITY_DN4450_c0_g2_i2.p1  ORF type:complete len:551 (+),score=142.38 TRINITY_DN4450_c0_g2_i2:264-1916(+)